MYKLCKINLHLVKNLAKVSPALVQMCPILMPKELPALQQSALFLSSLQDRPPAALIKQLEAPRTMVEWDREWIPALHSHPHSGGVCRAHGAVCSVQCVVCSVQCVVPLHGGNMTITCRNCTVGNHSVPYGSTPHSTPNWRRAIQHAPTSQLPTPPKPPPTQYTSKDLQTSPNNNLLFSLTNF